VSYLAVPNKNKLDSPLLKNIGVKAEANAKNPSICVKYGYIESCKSRVATAKTPKHNRVSRTGKNLSPEDRARIIEEIVARGPKKKQVKVPSQESKFHQETSSAKNSPQGVKIVGKPSLSKAIKIVGFLKSDLSPITKPAHEEQSLILGATVNA